jgi:hypothetical protein
MKIHEELLPGRLSCWDNNVAVKTIVALIKWSYFIIPMLPTRLDIEEVVKAHSLLWELDLGNALPSITEGKFILVKRGTEGPHTGKEEEALIDLFDFLFLSFFLKFLQVIVLSLVGLKFIT